jgi:hypothetical protein
MELSLHVHKTTQEDYSMFRRITNKRVLVALAAVAALAVAGIAYAYLTATGEGSGSGSVASSTQALTLSISKAPELMHIGDEQEYEISASNSGTSPEHVTKITVSSIAPSAAATTAGCPAGSFSAGTPTTTGTEVPAKGSAVVGHVMVHFNDVTTAAQNGCQGTGTVAISLEST